MEGGNHQNSGPSTNISINSSTSTSTPLRTISNNNNNNNSNNNNFAAEPDGHRREEDSTLAVAAAAAAAVPRRPSSAVQKVFQILDSPRRALIKSKRTSKRKQQHQQQQTQQIEATSSSLSSSSFTPTPTPTSSPRDREGSASASGFPQLLINRNNSSRNRMYMKMGDDNLNSMSYDMEFEFGDSFDTANTNNNNNNFANMPLSQSLVPSTKNIMHWLHDDAPQDIIPKVFSFVGPQTLQIVSRVNKSWRDLCLAEGVFRTLCEDYGKINIPNTPNTKTHGHDNGKGNGDDDSSDQDQVMAEGEHFWREYYCNNPIVPLDYPTIRDAVDATGKYSERKQIYEYRNDVRILLHPGIHVLENCVRVHTYGDSVFTVQTLRRNTHKQNCNEGSFNYCYTGNNFVQRSRSLSASAEEDSANHNLSSRRRLNSINNFRNIFSCRSTSSASDTVEDNNNNHNDGSVSPASFGSFSDVSHSKVLEKAVIVIKTKKQNIPLFHVTQGTMKISNLNMIHNCNGIDIWNGNTVIQSQPQFFDNRPIIPQNSDKMPHAIIDNSSLTSLSGRGIVAIDGGTLTVRKCRILDCAATGVYVGGPGSAATVEDSDIIRNGNGNVRNRRGIARGHSGVYLEQGVAVLQSCNVSNNSLTGISAISQTNAKLTVKDSDLVGNGTVQLEMPPAGSASRQRSVSVNNNISAEGEGRSRSGLDLEEDNDGEQLGRALEDVARRTFLSTARNGGAVINPPSVPLF